MGLCFFLYIKVEFELFRILFLSTFLLYLLIFLLPVIILHINYLNNNKYQNVIVEKNKLILNNILYNEIEQINIFATHQHFNDSVGVSALPYNDYYYYLEICLKGGEKIILSSLFDYKIDEIFKKNFESVKIIENPSSFGSLLIKSLL